MSTFALLTTQILYLFRGMTCHTERRFSLSHIKCLPSSGQNVGLCVMLFHKMNTRIVVDSAAYIQQKN